MVKIIFIIYAKRIIFTFETSSRAHLLTLFSVAMPALLLQTRWRICIPIEHFKCKNNSDHLLSPAKLQIILQGDCRRTRRTDGKRRITWPERLLLDLKAGKFVDKTDGNPKMAAVAQSLGRPDVGHKEFPVFLPSHHATAEGPLTPSPTIALYAPLLLRNLRAFRMP